VGLNPKAGEFIPRQLNSLPSKPKRGKAIKGLLLGPHDPSISTQDIAYTTKKRRGRVSRRPHGKHSKPLKYETQYKQPLQPRRGRLVEKKVFSKQSQRQTHSQRFRRKPQTKPREVKPKPVIEPRRRSNVAEVSVNGWFNPNSPNLPPERVIPPNPNKPFLRPMSRRNRNLNARFERFKPTLSSKQGARPLSTSRRGKQVNRFPAPSKNRCTKLPLATKLPQTPTSKQKRDIKGLVMGPHDPSVKMQTLINNRGRRKRKKRR